MQRIIFFNATVKDDISQSGCVLRDNDCIISGLVSGWTESYPDMTTHWAALCINSRTKTWQSLTSLHVIDTGYYPVDKIDEFLKIQK